jgi:hypothetical protein
MAEEVSVHFGFAIVDLGLRREVDPIWSSTTTAPAGTAGPTNDRIYNSEADRGGGFQRRGRLSRNTTGCCRYVDDRDGVLQYGADGWIPRGRGI